MYKTLSVNTCLLIMSVIMISGCQSSQADVESAVTEPTTSTAAIQKDLPKPTPKPEPAKEGSGPVITIENPVHDFGEMGPGARDNCTFKFKNTGNAELVINRVQSTCGCTVPELEKKEYAPGEEGIVKVAFQAPSVKSKTTKHLYIISNDPANPRAELTIQADVVVKVEISPESVDLRLDQDNAGMPNLVVKGLDDKPFSIRNVMVSPQQVMEIPYDPAQKGTEFTLKPVVDMAKLAENNTGVIEVKTDHPQSGILIVRYTALSPYEISRPRIILQNVEPGVPVVKDVIIRSNYNKDVEIVSATSRNGYMEIESQEKDGQHLQLQIKITPPEQDSSSRRYITDELDITLKDDTKLTIRCSGWFKLN